MERVIGLLRRKYAILCGILPIDFLQCDPNGSQEAKIPVIDRIIAVCAALTDLSNGIVPLDEKIVLVMTTSCFFKLVCLRKILLTM